MNRFRINQVNPPQDPEKPRFTIRGLEPVSPTNPNENLTQNSGLVRETNSLNGALGYEVVVFRKRGESLDYFRKLHSNQRISNIEAMFKEFTSYLVDISPKTLKFSQRFIGENYPSGFAIDFTVEYQIEDSVQLCHHLTSDPVGKMRDKMIGFFKEGFSSHDPAQTASVLRSLRENLLQNIREFAQRFGIAVSIVDLQSKLRDDIIQIEQKRQETEREIELLKIDQKEAIERSHIETVTGKTIKTDAHTLKIQDVKSELAIQEKREEAEREKKKKDAQLQIGLAKQRDEYERLKKRFEVFDSAQAGVIKVVLKAVESIFADIDSADDLLEKSDQLAKAINKLRELELSAPARPMLETTATPASFQELPTAPVAVLGDQETNMTHLLNEFFFQANNSIIDSAQQQVFKVAISDLKSQLNLGSQRDPEIMRLCWAKIEAFLPDEKLSEDAAKLKVQLRTLLPQKSVA